MKLVFPSRKDSNGRSNGVDTEQLWWLQCHIYKTSFTCDLWNTIFYPERHIIIMLAALQLCRCMPVAIPQLLHIYTNYVNTCNIGSVNLWVDFFSETAPRCQTTDRVQCGKYSINVVDCESRGCCWSPLAINRQPWCYHSKGMSEACTLKSVWLSLWDWTIMDIVMSYCSVSLIITVHLWNHFCRTFKLDLCDKWSFRKPKCSYEGLNEAQDDMEMEAMLHAPFLKLRYVHS